MVSIPPPSPFGIAMVEWFLITKFSTLDQMEVFFSLSLAAVRFHSTHVNTHSRHKILQNQKEFNFCSFSDASSSSTIYHPLCVNWEKHRAAGKVSERKREKAR